VTGMLECELVPFNVPLDIQQYDGTGRISTVREEARDPSVVAEVRFWWPARFGGPLAHQQPCCAVTQGAPGGTTG
jgi:hypothetical protein